MASGDVRPARAEASQPSAFSLGLPHCVRNPAQIGCYAIPASPGLGSCFTKLPESGAGDFPNQVQALRRASGQAPGYPSGGTAEGTYSARGQHQISGSFYWQSLSLPPATVLRVVRPFLLSRTAFIWQHAMMNNHMNDPRNTRGKVRLSNDASFNDRRSASAAARKAALLKFQARPQADDPAVAERQAAQMAIAAARDTRQAERKAAREAEAAAQAIERDARAAEEARQHAEQAALAAAADAEQKAHALALAAEQKAARDARYAARKARQR